MADKKVSSQQIDKSTEGKILAAGKKIFIQKGYNSTRVRDIATEAGINVSLVNYYFRSKEKLFHHIMVENVNNLFEKVGPVLYNEQLTLSEKIRFVAEHYIELLLENPDFPRFIVTEVMSGSNKIPAVAAKRDLILKSHFAKQILSLQAEGKIKFHPVQVLMNLMGLIIFPFLSRNLLIQVGLPASEFRSLMESRKRLIPGWIDAIIKS